MIQFKNPILNLVPLLLILLPLSSQTCWLSPKPSEINQSQIAFSPKYEFSLHPSSGMILSTQFRQKSQQKVYYGDLGVLRLYTKDTVMVYEGAYMKVMGLLHRVDPWLSGKYKWEAVELQIVYGYAFGRREGKYYGQAGVSYFIAAVDKKNETFIDRSKKFINKLIGLEKDNKFNVEDYFKPSAANLANNLYFYNVPADHLETFLPLASDKSKPCERTLWLLHRNVLEIDLTSFKKLKQFFKIPENPGKPASTLKIHAAKLRSDNKKQTNVGSLDEKPQTEKQSNSCPQNQQL